MSHPKYYFEDEVFSDEDYEFEFFYDEELIEQILILIDKGKSLELGCGEGGNSLILAGFGFDATCIDISKSAIKAIRDEASKRKVSINAVEADLEEHKIEDSYDLIFGSGFMHFLSKDSAIRLIEDVKANTEKGGINIFEVLLEGDITQSENPQGCYFKEKELKELYSDWEIIDYEEFEEVDENYDDEEEILNMIAKIVARK